MNKKGGVFIELVLFLIILYLLYKLGWLQTAWDFIKLRLGI